VHAGGTAGLRRQPPFHKVLYANPIQFLAQRPDLLGVDISPNDGGKPPPTISARVLLWLPPCPGYSFAVDTPGPKTVLAWPRSKPYDFAGTVALFLLAVAGLS